MDAIEKRALEPNPNVAVIHEAMQHFPEGSWMRGALDHAAAELAVLHGRCQRAALTPPEGYVPERSVLVAATRLRKLASAATPMARPAYIKAAELIELAVIAARPEVKA